MRHRTRWSITAVLVLSLMAAPLGADEQDPAFTDHCGVDAAALAENPYTWPIVDPTTPWTDLCAGYIASSGPAGLAVTLEVAGDAEERPLSEYAFSWQVDGCRYGVRHSDGPGEHREHGVVVSIPPLSQFSVTCGEPVERPCELGELGTRCYDFPPTTIHTLDEDRFRTVGTTLTWTLDFDGELAPYAGAHAPGQRVTALRARAAGPFGLGGGSYCVGGLCFGLLNDFASAQEHVIR
jgi:hypothetical protein